MSDKSFKNFENSFSARLRIQKYLSEIVYGGIDGSITTFAVVAGSAGANLDTRIVLILGFANLFADGFSMSVGNYLSAKAVLENYMKNKAIEEYEVDNFPEEEEKEIRSIYAEKGFSGAMLDKAVEIITSDKERWVNEMMKEELQMIPEKKKPFYSGLATFTAFFTFGLIPLTAYIAQIISQFVYENVFLLSALLTAVAFYVIGYLKSIVNNINPYKGIIETVMWGGVASLLAYLAGNLLENILM